MVPSGHSSLFGTLLVSCMPPDSFLNIIIVDINGTDFDETL